MSQSPQNSNKASRKKFLNVIYFVDSNKTKTFKFSLKSSYFAISFMVFMVFWSMFSTILLISNYHESTHQSHRIRKLLATIFNYQTRYDSVYEKSYPNDGLLAAKVSEGAKTSSSAKKKSEDQISLAAKPLISTDEASAHDDSEDDLVEAGIDLDDDTPGEKPNIKVEDYEFNRSSEGISLRFAVRNENQHNHRANGYVIGVAEFVRADGTKDVVTSPPGIKLQQSVNNWALPRNHRFSIRYYTKKTLNFDLPDENGGTFQTIKIIVGSKNNESNEFVYNIQGSDGTFVDINSAKNTDEDNETKTLSEPKTTTNQSPPTN